MGFLTKLKNKLASIITTIAIALGIQVARPPVIDHSPPPPEIIISAPTPAPIDHVSLDLIALTSIQAAKDQKDNIIIPGNDQLNAFLDTDYFESQVLSGDFTETNGLTNQGIYNAFVSEPTNTKVVFFYGTYYQNYIAKTMGYDDGTGTVYANSFYIDTPESFRSLELHEIAHQKGFRHEGSWYSSIPYTANRIIESWTNQK